MIPFLNEKKIFLKLFVKIRNISFFYFYLFFLEPSFHGNNLP